MSEATINFIAGMFVGFGVPIGVLFIEDAFPVDAYNAGANDALNGRLNPVVSIEDGDTTITYKLQWPD